MPAQTKDELLTVTDKEYAKLVHLLAGVSEEVALIKDEEETSIKDVIAHRAHWIDLFLGWYRDGQAGREVHFPASGYKWNDLKRYNADLREKQANLSWDEALDMLADRHVQLSELIGGLSSDALYGRPMEGAKNDWSTGRWAEASGASHYRSAAKFVRARLKATT